ncbi:MucB/RseB C-terminal domain-containing protein [Zwartia vadi]|uniref:MucB/RseB C-terminal domain-containing protein n=1 Tax=Zwartia vadi TaxID=3058168 RepID=UPI0025B4F282|nr:MucB/RseB C-terminal domain-containing protein [Zwartia vadi]MDN3987113.1 MucB/RseB C-terminal domain-containing protein [Zwartia vadi]
MSRKFGCALTLMLVSASALSQPSPATSSVQQATAAPLAQALTDQSKLNDIVRQIQHAARTLNYVGVFAFQQGERFESSRITHLFDGKNEKERIEVLDGAPREYLRFNDEVQALMPDRKLVLLERQRGDRFPGLLLNNAQSLEKNYSVRFAPDLLRIAGRPCRGIEITPRDTHRYGYRLCADLDTNLLLKAQMVGHDGVVIEQVAFTQVTIGADITESMLAPSWVTTDWRKVRAQHSTVDVFAQGWRIPAPAGYVATSQVERIFSNNKRVNQLVLSDGLATISIFIEPYLPERSEYEPQGAARSGSVNIFGIKVANFWLTVLGEVPAETLEQLAQSIQYVPPVSAR